MHHERVTAHDYRSHPRRTVSLVPLVIHEKCLGQVPYPQEARDPHHPSAVLGR